MICGQPIDHLSIRRFVRGEPRLLGEHNEERPLVAGPTQDSRYVGEIAAPYRVPKVHW